MILGYTSEWAAPELEPNGDLMPERVIKHVNRVELLLFAGIILFVVGLFLLFFI